MTRPTPLATQSGCLLFKPEAQPGAILWQSDPASCFKPRDGHVTCDGCSFTIHRHRSHAPLTLLPTRLPSHSSPLSTGALPRCDHPRQTPMPIVPCPGERRDALFEAEVPCPRRCLGWHHPGPDCGGAAVLKGQPPLKSKAVGAMRGRPVALGFSFLGREARGPKRFMGALHDGTMTPSATQGGAATPRSLT